ncbi:MAG TPA: hypothetical protein VIL48_01920 [Acidimicrobiales bacterium]
MAPRKKGMNPVIPIVIVLALVAVGVGAFFLLSGDDDGDSPESVVEALVDAASDQDCSRAVGLFSNASIEQSGFTRQELTADCEESAGQGSGLFSGGVELVSTNVTDETDDSATVEATVRAQGEEHTVTYGVVKEDGEWRIDFNTFGAGGSSQGAGPSDGGSGSGPSDGNVDDGPSSGGSDSGTSGGSGGGSASGQVPPEALADADPEDIPLAEACAGGDMAACDELWWQTPVGSNIEAFAESCGGIDPGGDHAATCEDEFG